MPPATERFAACASAVTDQRGGFRPHDPLLDGPSAHGIGLGLLSVWQGGPVPLAALRALGRDDARTILHRMVWLPVGAQHLPRDADLILFDFGLEAGVTHALAALQATLGTPMASCAAGDRPGSLAARLRAAHADWRAARGLPPPAILPTQPEARDG